MDYLGVLAFVLLADALLVSFPRTPTAVRTAIGAPLLLFLPGYALLGALFPGARSAGGSPHGRRTRASGPSLIQRLALSFGCSIALVPLLALAIYAAGVPLNLGGVLTAVSVLIVGFTIVAALRRERLPEDERFQLPVRSAWTDFRRWLAGTSQTDAALNAVLTVAVLLAVATAGFAFAAPAEGESYTTFALFTDQGGELVAGGYPSELTYREPTSLVASVENHEGHAVDYTAVIVLQQVDTSGDEVTVVDQQELDRLRATVDAGATWQPRHQVVPRTSGEDMRLTYLLYTGDVPSNPSVENAHRHLYLWVDVEGPGGVEGGQA